MLYVIIITLIALLAWREWQHDQERRHLLNRIQAPLAAQIAATEELSGDKTSPQVTEAERIRRRAEELGVGVDELRIPDGWS